MVRDIRYSAMDRRKTRQTKAERNKMKIKTLEAKTEACDMHRCKLYGPLMPLVAVMVMFAGLSSAQAADSSSGDPKETAIRVTIR